MDDAARATRGDKAAGTSAGTRRPAPGNVFLTHAQSKRRQSGLYRSQVHLASARQAPDRCWQTGTVDVALRELSVPGLAKGFPAIQILQSLQERPVGDKVHIARGTAHRGIGTRPSHANGWTRAIHACVHHPCGAPGQCARGCAAPARPLLRRLSHGWHEPTAGHAPPVRTSA